MTRVAVLGLGNAGFDLHLPALAGLPEVTVVGACDLDADRRARAAERWHVPVLDDVDRLLESTPDVVIICTPPESHADLCLRFLGAGVHVICEKPFVTSLADAERIIDAARVAGRQVALNHEFREMSITRAILERIGRPDVGELVFAQVWQNMDLPPWNEPGWRGKLLKGVLFEAGIHLVDYAMALFAERPLVVSASMSTGGVRDDDTDSIALATLEFSRGRLAQVVQNRLCRGDTQYFEVRADTTHVSLRASFGGRARLLAGLYRSSKPAVRFEYGPSGLAWSEVGTRRTILARNPRDPGMLATRRLLEKTMVAFSDGTSPPASAEVGRDALAVVAACYESARTGSRVLLDDDGMRRLSGVSGMRVSPEAGGR